MSSWSHRLRGHNVDKLLDHRLAPNAWLRGHRLLRRHRQLLLLGHRLHRRRRQLLVDKMSLEPLELRGHRLLLERLLLLRRLILLVGAPPAFLLVFLGL